jgi:hypothetical protein
LVCQATELSLRQQRVKHYQLQPHSNNKKVVLIEREIKPADGRYQKWRSPRQVSTAGGIRKPKLVKSEIGLLRGKFSSLDP